MSLPSSCLLADFSRSPQQTAKLEKRRRDIEKQKAKALPNAGL